MKQILLTTIAAVVLVGCGESSIHDAANGGNIEAVKQHIAAGADVNAKGEEGLTPLQYATFHGHKEIAELLIAEGADVNAKDDKIVGYPLHFAALFAHKEVAELLIAEGADVNAKSEITELFIALGAGVNAKDVDGETPLDWAIRGSTKAMPESAHPRHHHETADLLRKHGGKTSEELKAESK
jgi:ankyrin repeat protein